MHDHMTVADFLGLLIVILTTAKVFGSLARTVGQPAVLGELIGGVLVGPSVLGWVDPKLEVAHLLAEIGVIILLFEIGLETDLTELVKVGSAALMVAIVGVVAPFALGYAACVWLDLDTRASIVIGASLTATSVGITARVLSELGRLSEPESQIILGAAVIDDVIGLIILAVVSQLTGDGGVTAGGIALIVGKSFGFLAVALAVGWYLVPWLFRRLAPFDATPGFIETAGIVSAFGLAWLADTVGSAMIIGAFAAGTLLHRVQQARRIELGVANIGHLFVPLFFVCVGAQVDVTVFADWQIVKIGALLIAAAIVGKLLAGYSPCWFPGNKLVIGVGMVPRGEVGLIFAKVGYKAKAIDLGIFGAINLMVMVTTLIVPPLLRVLFPPTGAVRSPRREAVQELVSE